MSHFSVLVVTDDTGEDALRKALQPWHEYECTGVDDEYVVDVDVTDKLMKEWNATAKAIRLADGTIKDRYDEAFWVKVLGESVFDSKREFRLPEGAVEIELPRSELAAAEGKTRAAFAEEYGGWKERDGRFYDRTNPNKKWDWWVVGGRYSGRLTLKNGTTVDHARWGDLDFSHREKTLIERGEKLWAIYAEAVGDFAELPKPWPEFWRVFGDRNIEAAREAYNTLPVIARILERRRELDIWIDDPVEEFGTDRDAYLKKCAAYARSTYAIVKDGTWNERGEMGWFGMSYNEKSITDWAEAYEKITASIRPDQFVTMVDCHI